MCLVHLQHVSHVLQTQTSQSAENGFYCVLQQEACFLLQMQLCSMKG
jgi:hypothetical protein